MNRCKRCNVRIVDNTQVCPLCGNVVTREGDEQFNVYPDIRHKIKLLKRLVTIAVYLLIVAEVLLCLIDYYIDYKMSWCIVTGVCIVYVIFTLLYSFNQKNNYIRKIYMQFAAGLVLMLLLDFVTGWLGWSIVYGVPCAVLFVDCVLVVCMLIDYTEWQSYLLVQLFVLIISFVMLILYFTGVTHNPILSWTSFGISALIFSFCLILDHRKAQNELKRRFYI